MSFEVIVISMDERRTRWVEVHGEDSLSWDRSSSTECYIRRPNLSRFTRPSRVATSHTPIASVVRSSRVPSGLALGGQIDCYRLLPASPKTVVIASTPDKLSTSTLPL